MKPDFKLNFAKRDVIAMVCFTVVMIVVLVLGNTFGFVSADDTGYLLNVTDYESSSDYDSNIYVKWFGGNISQNSSISYDFFVNDFDYTLYNNSSFDASTIKYYMIFGASYTTKDFVYLFSDDSFCFPTSPYAYEFTVFTKSPTIYVGSVSSYGDGTNLQYLEIDVDGSLSGFTNTPDTLTSLDISSSSFVINGVTWYTTTVGDSGHLPILGNIPYYSFYNSVPYTSYGDYISAYLNDGTHSDVIKDINYLSDSVILPGFDNMVGGSDSDGEDSSNNLYLNNPYWSFNLPHNDKLTSTNGTVTFNAVPTDYQLEYPNQFELHYWFQIDVTYTFNDNGDGGFSGAGHGFSILNSIRSQDSLGTTIKRSRTGIFKYRYNGSDSAVSPFSEFDGSQTFQTITVGSGWNKIFRQCYLSGNTSYNTFYDWWKDYGRTTPTDNDSLPVVTYAKLKCYAQLYDSTSSSGICAYYYDFLTGESGVLDDSMGVNTNPFDFDTQEQYSNSSSGYGYVTQNNNNNQSVVINNNTGVNSDDTDSLKDQLEATLGDEQGGLIDTFKSKAQSNGWLLFMNSIFGFVPNSIWLDLATFLATCLGIFVVFLILRFLLDLL